MNTWNKVLLLACIILLPITSVHADHNAALMALLEALHENGTIDAATYAAIRQVAEQGGDTKESMPASVAESSAEAKPEPETKSAAREQPKIDTRGKLEVTSPDGDFSFRVGGRLHVDGAFHSEDRTAMGDDVDIRRARILFQGRMWRHWLYKVEYDFRSRTFADAYMAYDGLGPVEIRVGNMKEPFSLQNMISSNNTTFTERALPFAMTHLYSLGGSVRSGGDHWSAAVGVFGSGIDEPAGNIDQGYGASGRVTWAPIVANDRLLHVGGSLAYRSTDQNDTLTLSNRPESNITDVRLVNTGAFPADDLYRYGVEAAAQYRSWELRGEYIGTWISRDVPGLGSLNFDGYYVEASWFLTGESSPYSAREGIFGSVKPATTVGLGGIGAWQLATRFSSVDLNDGPVNGGRQRNLTVGLNWYPNANMRFMANYIRVLSVDGGAFDNDEPDIFAFRGQVVF